jgi:chemotaxis protein methyltransferase CheR
MSDIEKNMSDKELKECLSLIKKLTGITMEERKRDLLVTRIRPQLRKLSLTKFSEYIDRVNSDASIRQSFINLVTTNETHFFRTDIVWNFFESDFLPKWYQKNKNEVLQIWSAASSTGAEAYSIAMLCEEFKSSHPGFSYKVEASDISTQVLSIAEQGIYTDKLIDELKERKPILFQKYIKLINSQQGQVVESIKNKVSFSVHNLHQRPKKSQYFDIVFLRNVLIYFNEADQKLVLSHIKESLIKEGILIIGESESLSRLDTDFMFAKPLIYSRAAA